MSQRPPRRFQEIPPSSTVRLADTVAQLRHQGVDVVDFSAGRAAEHTPEYICRKAAQALEHGDTHQTMAQGTLEFREACACKLARENGITADPHTDVMATLGCKEGLVLALLATIDPGDEGLVEDPCFVSYRPAVRIAGGVPVGVPLTVEHRLRWTEDDLERAITPRTRAVVFCSPQNPTGVVHSEADLDVVADVAGRHDLIVITDETYERLAWGGRRHTCLATRAGMAERTITLMGLTKAFSMGGWRIGFAHAPERLIQRMVVIQQHLTTCAGSFVQAGAVRALADDPPPEVTALWEDWERRCAFAVARLDGLPGVQCAMPEGGFYAWIDVRGTGRPSTHWADALLKESHVALVPGIAFGPAGEGYLRMTCVRSWEELRAGLARLEDAFRQA